jgi:NAD(P)-dependent dehydrogenase (short-subunit alcohol dehydrogenase family)
MNIAGQTAIITGGGSGMGAETARQMAAMGAYVAILDRDLNAANQVAQEIKGIAIECDVASAESVDKAIRQVIETLAPPRICINCAGILAAQTLVNKEGLPASLDDFSRVIQVNLIGTFNTMRLAAAAMAQLDPLNADGERGVIINTASIAAYEGQIGQTAYSASKGGVVSLTLPAARDLARYGIRVVAIAPGLIETPMFGKLPLNVKEALGNSVPFPKRLGKPQEYAKLAIHIIENPMLNGCVIRLDGALRLEPK